jgi:hypothetical protein
VSVSITDGRNAMGLLWRLGLGVNTISRACLICHMDLEHGKTSHKDLVVGGYSTAFGSLNL